MNRYDQRLHRITQLAVLIMESFAGFEHKYNYCLTGHNGDSAAVPLVAYARPPKDRREVRDVINVAS